MDTTGDSSMIQLWNLDKPTTIYIYIPGSETCMCVYVFSMFPEVNLPTDPLTMNGCMCGYWLHESKLL